MADKKKEAKAAAGKAPRAAGGDVHLGGKLFNVVNFERRTVLIHCWMDRAITAAGIDKVLPLQGEEDTAFLLRIQQRIIHSGQLPDILGGYLLPPGKTEHDWTPEMGAQTSTFIGLLDTEDSRIEALTLATEVAFGFFRQWIAWFGRFPKSSSDSPAIQKTTNESASAAASST